MTARGSSLSSSSDGELRHKLFEQIGQQQKLFKRADLERARALQRERGLPVGDALVELGTITGEQLKGLWRAVSYRVGRDEDKAIAKIIVDSHYCDAAAVDEALRRQKAFYKQTGELMRLGALLVEADEMTESQRIAAYKIHKLERRPGT